MTRKAALVLTLLLTACYQKPDTFSVDPAFSEAEQIVIRDAVQAWCDMVEYCPTEVKFEGRKPGAIVAETQHIKGYQCAENMGSEGNYIRIDPECRSYGLDMLWAVAAHEVGHYCIDGDHHTDKGLMSAMRHTPVTHIDVFATMAWYEHCPKE